MTCSAHRPLFASWLLLLIALLTPMQNSAQTPQSTNQTPAGVLVQLTAEDYARSNQMRPAILREKLRIGFVIPHWLGQQDEFWYRRGRR